MSMIAPPWKDGLSPTPLHPAVTECAAANDWVRWGDYSVARTYSSWEDEYDAIRRHVGIADLTPSVRYRMTGQDAEAYLNRLVTRDMRRLRSGARCATPLCNEHGHVIDIVHIERVDEHIYDLAASAKMLPWLLDSAIGFDDVAIEDVTGQDVIFGLYGVASCATLLMAGAEDVEKLNPHQIGLYKIRDAAVVITRTGALGEMAYEIRAIEADALNVWDRLLRVGKPLGLKPVGRRALDMCRIELGHLSYGQDYIGALAARYGNRPRTPAELGLDSLVDMKKDYFTGKRAFRQKTTQHRTKVIALHCDGLEPMDHAKIFQGDRLIGTVTSSCWSPKLKSIISLATVTDQTLAEGVPLTLDVPRVFELEPDHMRINATVVARPFYRSPARNAKVRGS